MDFVSVVCPTYNRREFIPFVIEQFNKQTYPQSHMELILLDDSETSNQDLIPPQQKNIIYVYDPIKLSLGKKRNKINDLARGKYIICFDDDDYQHPKRVSYTVTRMNSCKAQLSGSTICFIYFCDIDKIFKFGPYGRYHSTNNMMAYTKEFSKKNRYNENDGIAEEKGFLKNFTLPMLQLDASKLVLTINHTSNVYDKRNLLNQGQGEKLKGVGLDTFFIKKQNINSLKFIKSIKANF
jgi:glycosyltransferase involved in cell wall biosynthesis